MEDKMVVWKYKIDPTQKATSRPDAVAVLMAHKAKILHVGVQDGEMYVWVLCDPERGESFRHFRVVGTGETFVPGITERHIGTCIFDDGSVLHVFVFGE